MKYYVYFDAYGNARQIINEQQLADEFHNNPNEFLAAMCRRQQDTAAGNTSGHVGTLSFDNRKDLEAYLAGLGDEIADFYVGSADSRPYNF